MATTIPQNPVFAPASRWFVLHFMLVHGHQAPEPLRARFIVMLLTLADLEGYPRRTALEAAFAPGGSFRSRCIEADALARAAYLAEMDYRCCLEHVSEVDDEFLDRDVADWIARHGAAH